MGNYRYKATNDRGERIEGIYEAPSKDAVMEMISINNYYPLMVEEIKKGTEFDLKFLQKVKVKDISIFARQFYTMLDAGAPINTCLEVLSEQITNPKLSDAIKDIHEEVRKGGTLSEAMAQHSDVFPQLFISMVAAGEMTGNLDTIMLRMSNHYEKDNKLNNKIRSAMIYPIVLACVAIIVVSVLLVFVMPTFVGMFKSNNIQLPTSTKILLAISDTIRAHWILIIFILIGIAVGIRYYFKSSSGVLFLDKMKLKIPIVKKLSQMIVVSRFTRTLATVISSGITLIDGLNIVSQVVSNKVVEVEITRTRDMVMKGESLAASMSETSLFPPMLLSMISIGEESGSMDSILNKTADFYDEELETQIQMFTALLEPLMIVVMGLVIGFMVISLLQPMFTMYSGLS
ncbi:type II secretion system F family protein [Clostridium sp. 19966]|uniref:type II secretion system F family protein n=1 Tax=Clostridium sp. 19966 TaxID=2768166 RepID=UPI0028E03F5D|nr:type II secretion system F family protein [Clostridium sp. 19966]MDT8715485.1 type II secretion system F family protein [Clostridium sp. 19966]